ncbi:unnamed protein product, partial [Laminaria digitata]
IKHGELPIWLHTNCMLYTPECFVEKPVYYGVDEARKRVALKCTSCGSQGALIGCHVQSCQVNTHYACAIREGWKF